MLAVRKIAPFGALIVVAAYLCSLTFQFDYPRAPGRLGPDIWPQIVLVLLILTCLVGIANTLFQRRSPDERASQSQAGPAVGGLPSEMAEDEDVPSRYGLVAIGFALFFAYPVVLQYLGFLVATFLLMALFMIAGQWRSVLGVLATSTLGTLVLFYIFRGIVYVSLPLGVSPFHDLTVWVASALGMR